MDINTYFNQKLEEFTNKKNNIDSNDDVFKTIVDFTPNAILIVQDEKIVFANQTAFILLNYTEKELFGLHYSAIINPENNTVIADRLLNLKKDIQNKPIVIQYMPKKSSGRYYLETTSIAITFNHKKAVLVVGRDITEEYNLRLEIEEKNTLLKQTENLTKTGSYKINLQTGKATWTPGLYDIFNYPANKALPTLEEYYNFVHSDDIQLLKSELNKSIKQHKPFDLKYRIKTLNDEIRYVQSKGTIQTEKNTRFLVGSFMDISKQIITKQLFDESEAKYCNLVENIPIGIIKFNSQSIVFANQYCRKILGGYTSKEIENKSIFEIVADLEKDRFKAILNQHSSLKEKTNTKYILSLKTKNNDNVFVELHIYNFIKGAIPLYKCFFENITDRTRHYNYTKKVATDAIYLSRKIEAFSNIRMVLDEIIKREGFNKTVFLDLFKIINSEWNLEQLWAIFQSNFDNLEKNFFKKLLSLAPSLTQQELKHCAFIRLNFETKDIATMFQVKPSSIQISRVRLKKKLNLSADQDLIPFILLL